MENLDKNDLNKILDRLYQCRNLEITNLWQRSIFLSVFLTLIATGYSFIFYETIKPDSYIKTHIIAMAVAYLGVIFSILWILMAKSSKSWYEVYELAITAFEQKYSNLLNLPESFIMGKMVGSNKDSNIYSQSGGVFSPSKINILIGQVCLSIFIFLIGYHLITILEFKNLSNLPTIALASIIMFFIVDTIITYSKSTFLEIQKKD